MMGLHIKFRVSLMPLTPSSMAHKFNGFIHKRKKNCPTQTVQSIQIGIGSVTLGAKGSLFGGRFRLVIGGPHHLCEVYV